MKVLVAYDGTLQSKSVLKEGLGMVRENGGELVAFHVFPARMFIDYDATPYAEAIARRESSLYLEQAREIIREAGEGIRARVISEDGDPEEETAEYARAGRFDVLLFPPRLRSVLKKLSRADIAAFSAPKTAGFSFQETR